MPRTTRARHAAQPKASERAAEAAVPPKVTDFPLPADLASLSINELNELADSIRDVGLKELQANAVAHSKCVPRKIPKKWSTPPLDTVLTELQRCADRPSRHMTRSQVMPPLTEPAATKARCNTPAPDDASGESDNEPDNDDLDPTYDLKPDSKGPVTASSITREGSHAFEIFEYDDNEGADREFWWDSKAGKAHVQVSKTVDDEGQTDAKEQKDEAKRKLRSGDLTHEQLAHVREMGERHAQDVVDLANKFGVGPYTITRNMGHDERERRATSFWNKFQLVFWRREHEVVETELARQEATQEPVTVKLNVEEAFKRCMDEYRTLKIKKGMSDDELADILPRRKDYEDAYDLLNDPQKTVFQPGDTIRGLKQVRQILTSLAAWWAPRGIGIAGWAVSLDPVDPTASAANFTFAGDDAGREYFEEKDINMMLLLRDFETFCRFHHMEERDREAASKEHTYLASKDDSDRRKKTVSALLREIWAQVMNKDKCAKVPWQRWAADMIKARTHTLGWPKGVPWPSGPFPWRQMEKGSNAASLLEALCGQNGREIRVQKWDEKSLEAANGLSSAAIMAKPECQNIVIIECEDGQPLLTVGQILSQAAEREGKGGIKGEPEADAAAAAAAALAPVDGMTVAPATTDVNGGNQHKRKKSNQGETKKAKKARKESDNTSTTANPQPNQTQTANRYPSKPFINDSDADLESEEEDSNCHARQRTSTPSWVGGTPPPPPSVEHPSGQAARPDFVPLKDAKARSAKRPVEVIVQRGGGDQTRINDAKQSLPTHVENRKGPAQATEQSGLVLVHNPTCTVVPSEQSLPAKLRFNDMLNQRQVMEQPAWPTLRATSVELSGQYYNQERNAFRAPSRPPSAQSQYAPLGVLGSQQCMVPERSVDQGYYAQQLVSQPQQVAQSLSAPPYNMLMQQLTQMQAQMQAQQAQMQAQMQALATQMTQVPTAHLNNGDTSGLADGVGMGGFASGWGQGVSQGGNLGQGAWNVTLGSISEHMYEGSSV
ncbi:hypothetical protein M422DRAFT_68066 [Sphaerobolus stellatus SS14]|uniref:Uncharacterized protein n=1 Tax=Sphaerobolus stellatus (strain SS14) TaxID=990650 RepID=A0A0C9UG78_SPHS4|nr:hypothetical protein M422DRAFT_68066 [Sphaerobolus stellatus SS14]